MRTVHACAFAVAVGWASRADAHPGYPAVVDSSLGLKTKVETIFPSMGCQLCHNSAGGGDQLKKFGSLLVSTYGLSSDPGTEHDPSLEQALVGLKAEDPTAVEDLEKGVDPNGDPAVFATAVPTPEYGCSTVASPTGEAPPWLVLLPFIVLVGTRRQRDRA
jgi:hypothetical protein